MAYLFILRIPFIPGQTCRPRAHPQADPDRGLGPGPHRGHTISPRVYRPAAAKGRGALRRSSVHPDGAGDWLSNCGKLKIAGRRFWVDFFTHKKSETESDIIQLEKCRCPTCVRRPSIGNRLESLRDDFYNRSIHNAWVITNQFKYWPQTRGETRLFIANGGPGPQWAKLLS